MGFLNNSTANIILDAVLTNKGRESLANGVGNFSISNLTFFGIVIFFFIKFYI